MVNISETRTERPSNNFGLKNFYTSESLFNFINKNHLAYNFKLNNNWKDITRKGYDPIGHIDAYLHCSYNTDNHPKMYYFDAKIYEDRGNNNTTCFDRRFRYVNNLTATDPVLHSISPKKDKWELYVERNKAYTIQDQRRDEIMAKIQDKSLREYLQDMVKGLLTHDWIIYSTKYLAQLIYLDEDNKKHRVLDFDWGRGRTPPKMFILDIHDFVHEIVSDFKSFEENQSDFFYILEESIRTIYKNSGKGLPPVKLELKSEEGNQTLIDIYKKENHNYTKK